MHHCSGAVHESNPELFMRLDAWPKVSETHPRSSTAWVRDPLRSRIGCAG